MKRTLEVFLGENSRRIGTLHHDQSGAREHTAFTYDAAWLEAPDGFPLAPGLPRVRGPQFHRRVGEGSVFPGIIADTEPDGWGRRVILREVAAAVATWRKTGRRLGLTSPELEAFTEAFEHPESAAARQL